VRACCGSEPSAASGRSRDLTQPFEPHRCTAGIDHWEQGLRWTRLPLRHRHRFGVCGDMVSLKCLSALLVAKCLPASRSIADPAIGGTAAETTRSTARTPRR
jgi:hypothetical protein